MFLLGSSAGAGSGDFHVYRGVRRREYARQKFLKEKYAKVSCLTTLNIELVDYLKYWFIISYFISKKYIQYFFSTTVIQQFFKVYKKKSMDTYCLLKQVLRSSALMMFEPREREWVVHEWIYVKVVRIRRNRES